MGHGGPTNALPKGPVTHRFHRPSWPVLKYSCEAHGNWYAGSVSLSNRYNKDGSMGSSGAVIRKGDRLFCPQNGHKGGQKRVVG